MRPIYTVFFITLIRNLRLHKNESKGATTRNDKKQMSSPLPNHLENTSFATNHQDLN